MPLQAMFSARMSAKSESGCTSKWNPSGLSGKWSKTISEELSEPDLVISARSSKSVSSPVSKSGGKILVAGEEFDWWMSKGRSCEELGLEIIWEGG